MIPDQTALLCPLDEPETLGLFPRKGPFQYLEAFPKPRIGSWLGPIRVYRKTGVYSAPRALTDPFRAA